MNIFTPINQVKLTNVSVVRLKKAGKRFEIACYKNKVLEWRNNVETDLDNVLQSHQIFSNVSKGQLSAKEDLNKAFKTEDTLTICLEILKKGELQVSDKERSHRLNTMTRDIATIISEKTVNPETNRPYPVTMIEKVLTDLHFSLNPNKNPKQQALEVIKQLKESKTIPISRAQMRVRLVIPSKEGKRIKQRVMEMVSSVEDEEWGQEWELTCLTDPGQYRLLAELIQAESKGKGNLELLNLRETEEGEEKFI